MSEGRRAEVLVVFSPSGRRGRFAHGTSVLMAARSLGVDLDSVCGGRALCGRCQVQVVEGELAKHGIRSGAHAVTAEGEAEARWRAQADAARGFRLACQAGIVADVAIDVPPGSQMHRQLVRKPSEAHDIALNPVIRACYVEIPQCDLASADQALQSLLAALAREWSLASLQVSLPAQRLHRLLLEAEGRVTAVVREDRQLIALRPGLQDQLIGAAVDLGSTSLAVHLCDLATGKVVASAAAMNPQVRFGEDLMSRVSYVMLNPGGQDQLTRAVRDGVNALLAEAASCLGLDATDLVEMTVVGNPVMHHLFLGLSPVSLGVAPFSLVRDQALSLPASAVGIGINEGAEIYVLPCIAGHVGADAAAVLLAEALWEQDELTLVVDVGTNAEILLGNRHRIVAASSPTGPAFEGAQIGAGQRATAGAIERVRIDPQTLEPRFKVIGCELWSDDPGFAGQVPAGGITGICGSGIIEAVAEMFLAGIIQADGEFSSAAGVRSKRLMAEGRTWSYLLCAGPPQISISQKDVREIQLAKAALYAGIRLLMDRLGVARVDRIRLAGAFGSQIDVKYAMTLGMIPDCRLQQVSSAGNAAGTGARIALLDGRSRELIEQRVRQVERIETATEPDFQRHFVAAMAIPHQSDSFSELARVIDLPTHPAAGPSAGQRRRRRRTP